MEADIKNKNFIKIKFFVKRLKGDPNYEGNFFIIPTHKKLKDLGIIKKSFL